MIYNNHMSRADNDLLYALDAKLPGGWVIEVEGGGADAHFPGVKAEYWANVFNEADPRGCPWFIVGRLCKPPKKAPPAIGRAALYVKWMDGSTFVSAAFASVAAALDVIPSGIFAGAEANLATVGMAEGGSTAH